MKRRALIVRTVTGVISASVFTATGWLMGTRTLTMENIQPCGAPCPGGTVCNQMCYDGEPPLCFYSQTCGACAKVYIQRIGCNGLACDCYCGTRYIWGTCYSCPSPCPVP
jgi:hypothetical protein